MATRVLDKLRQEVWEVNVALHRTGLVVMHSGNASGCDRRHKLVVIKPSGVDYETLRPRDLVVVDFDGKIMEGQLLPSVDLPHHLYLYRHRPEIGGIVHTHSNYATCFALLGRSLPVYLTAMADEFGGEIPCAPYVDNEGDHIGEAILRYAGTSPAVLLAQHGAFAFGVTARAALKTAVMLEDVAKTCYLALQLGQPQPLQPEEVAKWRKRYLTKYGQF